MIYIKKNKFGYWQISQKATDKNKQPVKDSAGNDVYVNMTVYFKQGCEPTQEELNKYNSYEFELQAVDKQGHIRKVGLMPCAYVNNQGVLTKETRMYVDDWQFAKADGTPETPSEPEPSKDDNSPKVVLSPEDLPFY